MYSHLTVYAAFCKSLLDGGRTPAYWSQNQLSTHMSCHDQTVHTLDRRWWDACTGSGRVTRLKREGLGELPWLLGLPIGDESRLGGLGGSPSCIADWCSSVDESLMRCEDSPRTCDTHAQSALRKRTNHQHVYTVIIAAHSPSLNMLFLCCEEREPNLSQYCSFGHLRAQRM